MACSSCSTGKDGKPGGCKSNGGCASGGCNRLNTYDWLSKLDIYDTDGFDIVEVSFNQGSRKYFYHNPPQARTVTGDRVVVETDAGYDIGTISLSGELVRMQMRKKRVDKKNVLKKILRRANERDLERQYEARKLENQTMIRARAIARTLGLEMKIGDVEYQADRRKATFYYTADGRVDFRELIRHYAKEFKVKIEMRQIGARQESARIGGIGSCGRELCCSTWLSDFKTVSTAAARYQNLAINQAKLSGQCGRLKCCLNYELDTYIDALEAFPKKADYLHTEAGKATLVKTDIFGGLMYYCYIQEGGFRGKFYPLKLERVKEILAMNKRGEKPTELMDLSVLVATAEPEADYESVNDVIELPPEERKRRRKSRNRGRSKNRSKDNADKKSPASKSDRNKPSRKGNDTRKKSNDPRRKRKENNKPDNRPKKDQRPTNKQQSTGNKKPAPKKTGTKNLASVGTDTNPNNNKPNENKSSNNKRRPNRNKNRRNRPPRKTDDKK